MVQVKKVPGDGLTEDSVNLILAAMEKVKTEGMQSHT